MSILKKIATQTAIYGLTSVIGRVLNFLLTPLYTGMFLVSEYAVITDVYAIISIFIVLLTYGMETAFFRFASKSKNKPSLYATAFFSVFCTSLCFLAVGIFFQNEIAAITKYPNDVDLIKWSVYILTIDAILSIPFAQLRLENKALKYARIKLTNIFIFIGGNLLFLWYLPKAIINNWYLPNFLYDIYDVDLGLKYIFLINLVASLVTMCMMFSVFSKYKPIFNITICKEMIKYGFPILIVGLAGIINETMDRQFLKYLLPEDEWKQAVGVYGACYKLSIFMMLFIQAYRMGVEPFFFSYAKEKNSKQVYASLMNYFVIVMSVIFLVLISGIDIIKYFLRSTTYWEGLNIVPILLLANLFFGVYVHLSMWYKLSDKTKYGAYISLIGALITVIINFSLIPVIGYEASAWATLTSYGTMAIISFVMGRKYYYIPYNIKKIVFYLGFSLTLSSISFFFYRGNIIVNILLNLIFIMTIVMVEKENLTKLLKQKN